MSAKFYLDADWILELECERFSSGATVVVKHPYLGRKEGYAIWLLMKAFKVLTGKSYGDPSIENQMHFLKEESELIFRDPNFYEGEYVGVNDFR